MPDAEKTIVDVIRSLLDRRDAGHLEITPTATLTQDLDLDSLELAELSAALEDDLGRDPFDQDVLPTTVGELVAFYRS